MLLEALFAAAAEAVFSYILDTLEPAERLRDWLKRKPAKLAYQHALARTYAAVARQHPELTASLFNESFLTIEATPELAKFLTRHQHPDHTQLVRLWAKSIAPKTEAGQRSIEAWSKREDLNAAPAYFVELLTSELKHESALQPLFDSRALESLPAIEAKLDTLTTTLENNLKQTLAIASNYQQTIVNHYERSITSRSGGVDFQEQNITVGGDVVGRDKIVSNVYNSYFGDDFATLDELYVRPDAVFQRVRVQDFVGREWLTAKVDAFLNDKKRKSGVFLVVGEAGVGKTSFMAHLVTERRYLHLFAEQVPGDVNVSRALQSLGAQLVARYQIDPYKEKGTLPAIATFPDFLDKLLRLAADRLSVGEKIVIVCDALDEAGTTPNGNVFGLPSVLPDGVYFILSQRPVATVKLSIKADLVKETIDAAGTDNLNDVKQYLTAMSHRPELSNQLRAHDYTEADFVRILKERSGGVWMYLLYIVSEITAGSRAPLDLAALPSGLAGYYTDYWGDWCEGRRGRGDGPAKWNAVYAPLLATLAAAQLPMSLKLLLAWSKVSTTQYEVERLLRRNWRAYIAEREIDHTPHFALYHASLRDFLTGQVDRQGLTLEAGQLVDELSHRTRDAHAHVVEYYRQQCNGDWVKLVDDDYARNHLCLHLSASGDNETMYQLVAMSNAWGEARNAKEESYAGYLVDLNRVWQYAETKSYWDTGRQIRCALIESGIHSLAANISANLLLLLVQTGTWGLARALSHIQQIPSPFDRFESLGNLASLLPDELKAEALNEALAITDEEWRAHALTDLAPHLTDLLETEAISAARAITDTDARFLALSGFARHLPDPLKAEMLSTASTITNKNYCALVLSRLAAHLSDPLKAEALSAAHAITDKYYRALALSMFIPLLSAPLQAETVQEVLRVANAIANEHSRAQALINLVPYLPDSLTIESLQEALSTACALTDEQSRTHALRGLAAHLPDSLKAEALSAAHAIADNFWHAEALSGLVPHLPDPLKAGAIQEALSAAHAIADEQMRALALIDLAPHLPDPLKTEAIQEALSAARAITGAFTREYTLTILAFDLPDSLKAEVVHEVSSAARVIADESARAHALRNLAPHLPNSLKAEAIEKALSAARADADEGARAHALGDLAPHLPDSLKAEALSAVCAISFEVARAHALGDLAPHLPDSLKAEVLSAARFIADKGARAHALSSLAPHLPNSLKVEAIQEALSTARTIDDEHWRAEALTDLAPHLTDPLKIETLQEALTATYAIVDEGKRAYAMSRLVPHLTDPLKTGTLQDALTVTYAIVDESTRAFAMSRLVPLLPDPLKAGTLQDALTVTYAIVDEGTRASALSTLAPYLTEPLKVEALSAARAITDEHWRTEVLSELALHLVGQLQLVVLIESFPFAQSAAIERIMSVWPGCNFAEFQMHLWTEKLHTLAHNVRGNLLGALAELIPLIEHLGGQAALEEFFYALRDVTTWWP